MEELGYEAVGVDLSTYAIRMGKGGLNLIVGDAQKLPFGSESFDLITCFETLEHLPNPLDALDHIATCLKPKGVLVASIPSQSWIRRLYDLMREERTHISIMPSSEMVMALYGRGFRRVEAKGFLMFPIPPTLLNRYFSIDSELLATNIKLMAVKKALSVKSL